MISDHYYMSMAKSIVRMFGCGMALVFGFFGEVKAAAMIMASMFFVAEVLGIAEERHEK